MFLRYNPLIFLMLASFASCAPVSAQDGLRQKDAKHPMASPDRKQPAAEVGMVVEQFYKTFGATTVYSTVHAVKIQSNGNHIVIVSRAPKWDVIQYSLSTKKYFQSDFNHTKPFMQRTFALFSGNVLALAPVLPIKPATICGIKGIELQSPKSYYNQQRMRRQEKLCDSASPSTVHLILSHDDNFNPRASATALKVIGLPVPPATNTGFPLYCSYEDMDDSTHYMLKTVSAKKTSIPSSIFDLPAGYTKVKETADLLADPERDQELTDFLQERHH
ncbi:MAG TPA: hypothetical protein V6C69_20455 [Trichormus sp.]|jgi:hypothetical protein